MDRGYGEDHRRQLIDDVITPKYKDHDERLASVKYQAIGVLDDNYFLRHFIRRPKNTDYTRIPPLKEAAIGDSLMAPLALGDSLTRHWSAFTSRLANRKLALKEQLQAVSLPAVLASLLSFKLPRKYTPSQGLAIDWQDKRLRRLRWLTPLVLLIIAGAIIAILGPWTSSSTRPKSYPSSTAYGSTSQATYSLIPLSGPQAKSSSDPNSSGTAKTSSSSESAGSSTSQSSPSSAGNSSEPSSSNGSSSSGSGSSSGASGSGSSTASILPLTIPPQDVSAGGKQVISTGSITLN